MPDIWIVGLRLRSRLIDEGKSCLLKGPGVWAAGNAVIYLLGLLADPSAMGSLGG